MATSISMRELQRISAEKILALKHPTPIRRGSEMVAMLVPNADARAAKWRELAERTAAFRATLSPEERARIEALLGEPLDD